MKHLQLTRLLAFALALMLLLGCAACGKVIDRSVKFCPNCGTKKPEPKPAADSWQCTCGNIATGKFCPECGKPFGQ